MLHYELTPYAENILYRRMRKSEPCEVTELYNTEFFVRDFTKTYLVNLREHTCDCGKFRSSGIPCRHGLAAYRTYMMLQEDFNTVNIYFTTAAYRAAYQTEVVQAVPPQSEWHVPVNMVDVLPPLALY